MKFEVNDRGGWVIPIGTVIAAETLIPAWSQLGPHCRLGPDCKLGQGCELGPGCKLGSDCELEGGPVRSWLTMANVDGSGRQLLLIVRPDGTRHVRAGCFFGTSDEFVERAISEAKLKYAAIIPAVFAALEGV